MHDIVEDSPDFDFPVKIASRFLSSGEVVPYSHRQAIAPDEVRIDVCIVKPCTESQETGRIDPAVFVDVVVVLVFVVVVIVVIISTVAPSFSAASIVVAVVTTVPLPVPLKKYQKIMEKLTWT